MNEYKPWKELNETELIYFKRLYFEKSVKLNQLEKHLEQFQEAVSVAEKSISEDIEKFKKAFSQIKKENDDLREALKNVETVLAETCSQMVTNKMPLTDLKLKN